MLNKNANEIDAVNLKFWMQINSTALDKCIEASLSKNIPYVVAAGNSHSNASYFTPANNSGVITVSAIADFDGKCGAKAEGQMVKAGNFSGIENDDSFAPFSNYGKSIDIAAPGVNINSTNIKWGHIL